MNTEGNMSDTDYGAIDGRNGEPKELTEKQERYAQLRAEGHTMSKAASIAFDTNNPRQLGSNTEKMAHVANRIEELRAERNEAAGLNVEEQVRRYNDLYFKALKKDNLALAKQMLERLDAIGGFEAPKRSESVSTKRTEVLKSEDVQGDMERFAGVISKEEDTEEDSVH